MCDRTADFHSRCAGLQRSVPALGALCRKPLPSPPFPFSLFSLGADAQSPVRDDAVAGSSSPPPPCISAPAFLFLQKAAKCAEEQSAIEFQLHHSPHAARDGGRGSVRTPGSSPADAPAPSDSAGADVSVLLKRVHRQQAQLQDLENSVGRWDDVLLVKKKREEWENAYREAVLTDPALKTLLADKPKRVAFASFSLFSKSDREIGDENSEAAAHRHAVIGCLYAHLQDLTSDLKTRELALLQGQLDSRRYFSAYSNASAHGFSLENRAEKYGSTAVSPSSIANPLLATKGATRQLHASLAAAEAARTAERLLRPITNKTSSLPRDAPSPSASLFSPSLASGALETGLGAEESSSALHRRRGVSCRDVELTALEGEAQPAGRKQGVVFRGKDQRRASERHGVATGEGGAGEEGLEVDMQSLAREEQQLVETLSTDADLVQEVQGKLKEIVHCMDVFSAKVLEQSEACEHIRELAEAAVENVAGAGQHLTKALERTSAYRYYVLMFFLVAGCLVLLLDFLKSSSPYL
ncbi:hypothetical protein BESB_050550 [Besnoitia besnoiti]|uniref:t-SNARE coiled-coil homology domain-containing protein n=1 Tax=Besnoitia besnoiti TaxID=94643 RepID=A0A2A9MM64_BESBE|nr:hypothetical protein BESB_050550 [Besnoitia besnoiti]PFH36863.1 hypothetical protein BESB_050550 [Besnoitia besnoiti]